MHLSVLYFGVILAIALPVALAAYASAGITGTDPMKVRWPCDDGDQANQAASSLSAA